MIKEKSIKNVKTILSLLITFFILVLILIVSIFWLMSSDGVLWYKVMNTILLMLLVIILFATCAGILVFFGLIRNKKIPQLLLHVSNKYVVYLYPALTLLGQLIGKDKNEIRRSYTHLNNQVLLSSNLTYKPEEILILTPHCLQQTTCGIKITHDICQCKKCGKCSVQGLLELQEKYGVETQVVTGGTLARLRIKEKKPKMIIAIACERDLVSGLMDVRNVPVYAIINDRPEGPCQNTSVDIEVVKNTLNRFLRCD